MFIQSSGLRTSTYVFLSITLLLSLPALAETDGTNSDITANSQPASKSLRDSGNEQLQPPLDGTLNLELVPVEVVPVITNEEIESKSELQKLLIHEDRSHVHVGGKIMLNDDASIKHPSIHDIDGAEVDITIDLE